MGLVSLARKKDGREKRGAAAGGSTPGGEGARPRRAAGRARLNEGPLGDALLQLIPDMMFRMAADGTFLEEIPSKFAVRPAFLPRRVVGRHLRDLFPKRVADIGADALKKALRTGKVQSFEHEMEVAGELHCFDVRVAAIDGEECLAIVREVTGRRRAERALVESEERYRAMYEDIPSMYFTVDHRGKVLSVNRFGAEQLGYSVDELVGRSVLNVFYRPDRKEVRAQLRRCLESPAQPADWEFRKVRKDGSVMWVKEVARAVPGPGGDPIVLIVCEDITERKRTEEALQEAREELASRVEVQLERGNVYGLTFRELAVLNLVAAGMSDKEIATTLGITLRTANKHMENILARMGASSRTEAGVRAVREGLL
jgi:PAS domain S-box-containing protein